MQEALLAYLRYVLTSPVTITDVTVWNRPKGMVGTETIVWFPKVLFVAEGELTYQIEDRTLLIPAGHILYRPAWSRSRWRTTATPLQMAYCEFDIPTAGSMWREPFVLPARDPQREWELFRQIRTCFVSGRPDDILEAAGELKALLARLFAQASRSVPGTVSASHRSPAFGAIDPVLDYLEQHFASPDVLVNLHERSGLGVNRFRTAFRERLGITPQEYVLTLRMRAARYYLTDAKLPLKQVALAAGYDDPLYFSRAYRKFWGHPPTHDRHLSATGAHPPTPYTGR